MPDAITSSCSAARPVKCTATQLASQLGPDGLHWTGPVASADVAVKIRRSRDPRNTHLQTAPESSQSATYFGAMWLETAFEGHSRAAVVEQPSAIRQC